MLADSYAEDATYGWMLTPDEHFMVAGRDQIRDWAIGIEMDGFDGWHYDYMATVIDEKSAMIVGSEAAVRASSTTRRAGVRGAGPVSVRRRATGGGADAGQVGSPGSATGSTSARWTMARSWARARPRHAAGAPEGLRSGFPGHYRPEDLPSTVWLPPVEAGEHVTQEPTR